MTQPMCDVHIRGGVVVDSRTLRLADVFIRDGLVDSVEPPGSDRKARRVIDARGKFVLPGIVEAHLHPVYADRLDTLSRAAVHGGITTLIPYIGAVKAWGVEGNLWDAVNYFIDEGARDSVIDFGLHCSLVAGDMAELEKLVPRICERGVRSFKGFMAYRKRGMFLSDADLLRILAALRDSGGLFCVHAENGDLCDYLEDGFAKEGKTGPEWYGPSRPGITEAEATFRILSFANVLDCPMYVVHVSTKMAMDVIRLYRQWNKAPIYAETCTHYLTLTDEDTKRLGTLAKVSPPLRGRDDVDAMWDAVRDGSVDVIGSDTAGHMLKTKEPRFGNIFTAASGLPGQETMFTVTYDEGFNRRGVSLPRLVELMTEKPARIFGLWPRKGALLPGSDADVLIFDPTREHVIEAAKTHTRTDYSMYEDRRVLGAPELVMQRGEILLENGELKATKGRARFLEAKA
ncbi:MAG: amidohydrolase family protein [Burkholderiales bacterium]|nr:amidohydrolase family protein [Burkholderiales bacterium]MCC7113488.1 amidohydrolase family protein [Burkholderiales bacterium]